MKVHIKITVMMFMYMLIVIIILPIYNLPVEIIERKIDLMQDGWNVTINGISYEDVTVNRLKKSGIPSVKKGETISFSKVLTQEVSFNQPALLVTTSCSLVHIYLDDMPVYDRVVTEGAFSGYIPGRALFLAELPADFQKKTLTIDYTAEEDFSFAGITPPRFGERLTLIRCVVYRNLRALVIGIFMCVYGILFIIISGFFSKKVPQIQGQIYAAAICILIGMWMICYNEVFVLLYPGVSTSVMEYGCQFLSVPVFYVFLFRLKMPLKRQFEKIIPFALVSLSILIMGLWLLFKNYTTLLMLLFSIILVFGLVIIMRYFTSIRKTRSLDNSVFLQMCGVSVMMLECLIQCFLYYLEDFRGIPRGIFGRNAMSVGASTLAVSQMLNFFFLVTRDVAGQTGSMPLAQMAYIDSLTGIYNRSKAEEVTQKILHASYPFCIVMMDLNGLKQVNDINGHLSGDHLLKEFAQVLRVCIRKTAFYARIGGDEFVAIIENPLKGQAEELLVILRAEFDKLNKSDPDVNHSFAAGYAYSHEAETAYNLDGHDRDKLWKFTMKLADSRMYEQKDAMKAGMNAQIADGE